MQNIQRRLGSRNRQLGQGMTEYIIITALIAIAAIAAVTFFGGAIRSQIGGMAREVSGQSASQAVSRAQTQANSSMSEGERNKGLNDYKNDNAR